MQDELHEKATEIIGKILELSPEEANSFIEKSCKGDTQLKKTVLELYQSIQEDELTSPKKNEKEEVVATKGFSKSRIGVHQKTTTQTVFSNISNLVFGHKIGRLATLIVFLLIVFMGAFSIRHQYRSRLMEIEREEQQAILNIHAKSLEQWIEINKELIHVISLDSSLIDITDRLDKKVIEDPSYESIKEPKFSENTYAVVDKIRKKYGLESLSILNKRDPRFMSITGEGLKGFSSVAPDVHLGNKGYDYFTSFQEKKDFLFIPPTHDSERFKRMPSELKASTLCTFVYPVWKEGKFIGLIAFDSNVNKEFSSILNLSQHNETAETYAFNIEGRMISRSRFEKEIQQTFLLENDTTKESSFNIELLDPQANVFEVEQQVVPQIDQSFTRIVAQAIYHLNKKDGIYKGAISQPYNDYRGIKVIGTWLWFPQYNFGLINEIDESEAHLALHYFDGAFYLFLAFLLGLTILLYKSNVRLASFGKKMKDFQKLGQYHLKQKLGEGGFGEVYKAEHTFLKTPVAIKLLKKEFIGTDMLDRFQKEVKVTASLSNPNTVRVFDYGTSKDGQFYYVMEYLNGITLDKIVEQASEMPVGRVVHILLQISYSLAEAHNKGLVHRDVKPMNIMICNQGGLYDTIKLLDFGLVKNIDTSLTQQTQINRIGGTPMFMAPERLRDPYNANHKVDIYAIGAVGLYMLSGQFLLELISQKMLSGQTTLQGNMRQQLIERSDVPEDLKTLLETCISFSVDKRPETTEVLIDTLEKLKEKFPWSRQQAKDWWKKYDVYS
ncbi:serine/threonine-protein kinase [Flavicella marina]|uniref:serine/threonine-protein kinase n=1 Tax=Flavicella marina TaxID=1475951 RepID=UPI0012657F9E|nr:serine/threonine-protein kinase [Flavicella marina]